MSSSLSAQIISLLEKSIEQLKKDLKPLEQNMLNSKEGLFITHDSASCIIVYVALAFKAYIPKKYDGWDVKIVEWKPGDEIQLDIDFGINLE